ncbi:MAG: carboxylesterase family protein [Actinobacteria bacterium]|nr:carboxylesterase family protein [Actinomycetota bacterium]
MNDITHTFSPPCGPVEGWQDGAVIRATGIPYAAATRFSLPKPIPVWESPLGRREWGAACPQPPTLEEFLLFGTPTRSLREDENCLNLSVTLPADIRENETLPVLVWIHGGAYVAGAGDEEFSDPAKLVAEQRIVAVSLTYRLGVFGYLAGGGRPANLGLFDQLAALSWVRANILAFGGNPDEVTLGGHSAGADAVIRMLLTREAGTLVRRAIIQSAPLGIFTGRDRLNAALDAGFGEFPEDASIDDLLAVGDRAQQLGLRFGLRGQMPFSPRLGEAPLPAEHDVAAAWRDSASQVELLIGHTRNETAFFVPSIPWLARLAGVRLIGPIIEAAFVAATTAKLYGRGTRRFAEAHRQSGGRALRYLFTWSAPKNHFGAAHSIDLGLLFGQVRSTSHAPLFKGASQQQYDDTGAVLRSLWGAFIRGEEVSRDQADGILTFPRR